MSTSRLCALVSVCLLLLAIGGPVVIAQSGPAQTNDQPSDVLIDGRVVLRIRVGFRSITPDVRARAISERIVRLASDRHFNTASITVAESDLTSDIVAADHIVMSVLDEDALAEGRSRQELAAENAQIIKSAIDQYRRDHSSRNLMRSVLFALLVTLGLIVILFTIQRLHHLIQTGLPVWAEKTLLTRARKYHIVDPGRINTVIVGGLKFIRLIGVLVLLYFYVDLVFSFFPWTQSLADELLDLAMGPVKTVWHGVRVQAPNLLFIVVLGLISRYFLKMMRVFFGSVERGTIDITGFDRDWATPTYKMLRIIVIACAATIAYPFIPGSESYGFKGISIFLGVLVSFGSTSLVANVVSGLMITYMRAFKVGDCVKISDLTGEVLGTRLQVTHLKTSKNEIISVPNSTIINSQVMNYSVLAREGRLILHTTVGVGYNTPWRQVNALLLLAAEKTSGLLREPPPFVNQKSLDPFCVTYELNAYTDQPHQMGRIYSSMHRNILDVFNEYEVQIMTPHYETERQAPAIVPKDKWYAPPADRFAEEEKAEALKFSERAAHV